MWEMALGER